MNTSYFQGRDGFIWWNGVVEDRQDPLFLGRCKVRILGWHTEDKTELPTSSLPWAQVLMPVTSASQTNVGHAPVGPVEGTWVMGFYRDGELAQEPVMMGTIPGIPENFAKQGTGFNDPRLDVVVSERQGVSKLGEGKKGVSGQSLDSFPFPPKGIETPAGAEAVITDYSNLQRKNEPGGSLYPREIDVPTTSRYARGKNDSTSNIDTVGIVSTKKSVIKESGSVDVRIPALSLSDVLIPENLSIADSTDATKVKVGTKNYLSEKDFNSLRSDTGTIKNIVQPDTAYAAIYPYNHVYESESGHLIEQDDTPGKERLHWYHRSGTFTEFHPKGMRVDKTHASRFNIVTGSYKSIISGEEVKAVGGDYSLESRGKMSLVSGLSVTISSPQNIVINSSQNTYISGKNVILDAGSDLILSGGNSIIREDDAAEDRVRGNFNLNVGGEYGLSAGKVTLSSGLGATNIISGGPIQQIISGNSEETIVNKDYIFGNIFGKKITAINGMIGLESIGLIPLSGGISLNVGLLGAFGHTHILPTGDILINSVLGVAGVTTTAPIGNITQLAGLVASMIGTTSTIVGSSSSPTIIDGAVIALGGTGATEPAMLGTTFLKLFSKHTHPSPNGPTGPLSPEFAGQLISTVSKKVFLSA
jgi:hypothetical protein